MSKPELNIIHSPEAETFLRMGVDELSVSPAAVLPLRKRIRGLDLSKESET